MTTDTRQRIQRSTRFFAYLESFSLECPHCGLVYQVRKGRDSPEWQPRTGRFTCNGRGGCNKVYILGILAWPVVAAPHVASQPPEDQVPHPRQLAQLRREGGGWWLADVEAHSYPRPAETNLTTEENRPPLDEDEED